MKTSFHLLASLLLAALHNWHWLGGGVQAWAPSYRYSSPSPAVSVVQRGPARAVTFPFHYSQTTRRSSAQSQLGLGFTLSATSNSDTDTTTTTTTTTTPTTTTTTTPEETTEKYGLEAGLFQSLKEGQGESAKSLLKRYGIAYLATSIPLAVLSFAICYLLVDNGVDMAGLFSKIGFIESTDASEKAGTLALAYAAHKAASPIRFPPTVLLTPVVAKWIGKEPTTTSTEEEGEDGGEA